MLPLLTATRLSSVLTSLQTTSIFNRQIACVVSVSSCSLGRRESDWKRVCHSVMRSLLRRMSHGSINSGDNTHVIRSPHPDVDVDGFKNTPLPHYVMKDFHKYHSKIAMVDGSTGQQVTYGQLETMVAHVASGLIRHQLVSKGSVVTVYSCNCIEYAVIYLAVSSAGGILSPVNPAYTLSELIHSINHVQSVVLFTTDTLLSSAKEVRHHCPSLKEVITIGPGNASDCRPLSSFLAEDMSLFPANIDIKPIEDLVALPFSSGTTGLPKGVMLPHYSITSNILQSRSHNVFNYEPGMESIMAVLPFYHIYAQTLVMLTGLAVGAKLVTIPKFEPKVFLEAAQLHRVTYMPIVPPIILFLSQHPLVVKYDLSSLHTLVSGAAPAGGDTLTRTQERLNNAKLVARQAYGLTEASPLTHMSPPEDIRRHTVGTAIPNTEFKIIDAETGEALGPGLNGEICVRGPQLMKGYYNNEEATNNTIKDGWLHTGKVGTTCNNRKVNLRRVINDGCGSVTFGYEVVKTNALVRRSFAMAFFILMYHGDSGHYDEDGHLIIDDRIKELIKVKGFQVAPAELEAILLSHVTVQDAAVIGQYDERAGELPTAFIVLKPRQTISEPDLQHFVAERVAPYKRLTGGIIFCDEIPKSASGKILRRMLKMDLLKRIESRR